MKLLRKKSEIARGILGMLVAAAYLLVFALYCSARVGYFLLIALLAAPVLSVLSAFYTSRFVETSFAEGGDAGAPLRKGDRTRMTLTLRNRLWIPTALLRVQILDVPNLEAETREVLCSVAGRRSREISASFHARMAGGAEAGFGEIWAEDYFGLAAFPLRRLPERRTARFGIVPRIPEVSARTPILEETMRTAFGSGESEETSDAISYHFAGFPDYEVRSYVPGDPLRRIHSKASAKRGELLVRLDERPIVAGVVFLLDARMPEDAEERFGEEARERIAQAAENLIETALGMARTLLSRDFGVTLFWREETGAERESATARGSGDAGNKDPREEAERTGSRESVWRMQEVRTERELSELAEPLAFFRIERALSGGVLVRAGEDASGHMEDAERASFSSRIPGEEFWRGGSSLICFTASPDAELLSQLGAMAESTAEGGGIRYYNALTGEGSAL